MRENIFFTKKRITYYELLVVSYFERSAQECHCEEGVRRGGRLTKQSKKPKLHHIFKILDCFVRAKALLAMTHKKLFTNDDLLCCAEFSCFKD
jgi:hypothetical protein